MIWGAAAAAIAAATLVSEDLTCIATGLLVRRRELGLFTGLIGCTGGIYLGDLGLYLAGRLAGRRALSWRWVARRLPAGRLEQFGRWFDGSTAAAVIASRFLPGTRLPLYVAAGAAGRRPWRFVAWSFVAALLWTPAIILLVAAFGESFARPFAQIAGAGWLSLAAGGLVAFLAVRAIVLSCTAAGRARLAASVSRIWRWEFWPAWLFYAPLAPWIAVRSIRHGGFTTITAANPGIPTGGLAGESKAAILEKLPARWVVPFCLIEPEFPRSIRPRDHDQSRMRTRMFALDRRVRRPASDRPLVRRHRGDSGPGGATSKPALTKRVDEPGGAAARRAERLLRAMADRGWTFPVILKPDVGERGSGVKLVRDVDEAFRYFSLHDRPVLAQQYHRGPFEAGIFYVRMPGEASGRIFSITDKVFPEIVGDGRSTLDALIERHARYRMQARVFRARHARRLDRVLAAEERFRLGIAGNHCQGTLFRDGSHLATLELERAIDAIARSVEGFFFGRFDVRYSDVEEFRAGRDLAIVELNGVGSESTDIYDPEGSLVRAYRTLIRQWTLAFEIGARNRARGFPTTPPRELFRTLMAHRRQRPADSLAD